MYVPCHARSVSTDVDVRTVANDETRQFRTELSHAAHDTFSSGHGGRRMETCQCSVRFKTLQGITIQKILLLVTTTKEEMRDRSGRRAAIAAAAISFRVVLLLFDDVDFESAAPATSAHVDSFIPFSGSECLTMCEKSDKRSHAGAGPTMISGFDMSAGRRKDAFLRCTMRTLGGGGGGARVFVDVISATR